MSKVKNISGGTLDVPLLGRPVEDGETVEVPDFQPDHNPDSQPGDPDYLAIVWPGNRWEPVSDGEPPADETSGAVAGSTSGTGTSAASGDAETSTTAEADHTSGRVF